MQPHHGISSNFRKVKNCFDHETDSLIKASASVCCCKEHWEMIPSWKWNLSKMTAFFLLNGQAEKTVFTKFELMMLIDRAVGCSGQHWITYLTCPQLFKNWAISSFLDSSRSRRTGTMYFALIRKPRHCLLGANFIVCIAHITFIYKL